MDSNGISTVIVSISIVILLAVIITGVIGRWRIFTKAGVPGWKSIVPVLSGYEEYKLCWSPLFFWLTLALSSVTGYFQSEEDTTLFIILGAVVGLANFVLLIMKNLRLAKCFGKSSGFGVLLTLFPYIFYLVLGFGKAEYIGNTISAK